MFDLCRGWRRKLSQHADGTLPPAQRHKLENHLARCMRCREVFEADTALREVLGVHDGLLDTQAAHAFDDRVVAALRDTGAVSASGGSFFALAQRWLETRWAALPFPFLTQVAGGGLVAASVTMFCLLSALHPHGAVARPSGKAALVSSARNEPPVPLESLLRSPAPRAALLWTSSARSSEKREVDARPADYR